MQGYKWETDKYQKKEQQWKGIFLFLFNVDNDAGIVIHLYTLTLIKVEQQRLQDLTNQYCKLKMLKHFIFILIQNCTLGVQYKQMLDYD